MSIRGCAERWCEPGRFGKSRPRQFVDCRRRSTTSTLPDKENSFSTGLSRRASCRLRCGARVDRVLPFVSGSGQMWSDWGGSPRGCAPGWRAPGRARAAVADSIALLTRAAGQMAHDDDQGNVEVFGGILDAAQHRLVGHGASHADDKQVAQPLAEYGFGRHAGIRAGQHSCEGVLAAGHGGARRRSSARAVEFSGHIAEITGTQAFQRLPCIGGLRPATAAQANHENEEESVPGSHG